MDKVELYPLKFAPIYKSKIWGGTQIHEYKGLQSSAKDIGESWEISPMDGDVSVVSKGALQGKNLESLIKEYGEELLGKEVMRRYGSTFPLLVKLIYANDDLSIQVHPDDQYALDKHDCRGKTEMWYMLKTSPDACIYKGWSRAFLSKEALREAIKTKKLMSYLAKYEVRCGDAFYLPAGKVHTIGKGCLLLEIQEASDITYRLYDFGRKDAHGKQRELHLEEALKVLDYDVEKQENRQPDTLPITSEYFKVSLNTVVESKELILTDRDSFTILFCVEGNAVITTDKGSSSLRQGETLLLPANIRQCTISPTIVGEGLSIIDCFVPTK